MDVRHGGVRCYGPAVSSERPRRPERSQGPAAAGMILAALSVAAGIALTALWTYKHQRARYVETWHRLHPDASLPEPPPQGR